MKQAITIIVLMHWVAMSAYTQQTGCKDSIVFNKFTEGTFELDAINLRAFTQRDTADNIFMNGIYNYNTNTSAVLKFNKDNELVKAKWYRPFSVSSFVSNLGTLQAIDNAANLYFTAGAVTQPTPSGYLTNVIKLDSAFNILWTKAIAQNITPGYTFVGEPIISGNNLFIVEGYNVVALSATTGNLLWSKKYGLTPQPANFNIFGLKYCSLPNGNLLVCITGYTGINAPFHASSEHYTHLVKINGATGAVLQQQTLRWFTGPGFTNKTMFKINNLNYNFTDNRILLVGLDFPVGNSTYLSQQLYCLLDANLNPIQANYLKSNPWPNISFSNADNFIHVNKQNEAVFVYQKYTTFPYKADKLNYVSVNNNLQIVAQRTIDYLPYGFPSGPMKTNIGVKRNGTLNFQSGTRTGLPFPSPLLVYDHVPFYNSLSPCLGYDTTFFTASPAMAQVLAPLNFADTANFDITVNDIVADGTMENFTIPKTEICKQVSICDTIKVFGQSIRCISNPYDSFKIIRNPLCKRVTNWLVDTTAVKIISKNDTVLQVQYLKPFSGFIKAGFAGCTLADSLPVSVYNIPAAGLSLGNDVQACPGTPVTLRAGTGFKTYLWQDGSTNENFTATQPGSYHVTTTDSCDRVYRDTLLIFAPPVTTPYIGNDTMHCPGKTITINAGNGYNSYTWQDGSAAQNYTATLPGTYHVTVIDNCNRSLSDTIIIKPQDVPLAINFPYEICTWDTAKINLPSAFINYSWQPINNTVLGFNKEWQLYPGATTTYTIRGERPVGCIIADTVLIKTKVCPDYVFFPNAFTPNGDGLNDIYKPFIGGRIVSYDLMIFNRYGQTVFKTNNPATGWNGITNTGSKPLPGSYVWVCRYRFADAAAIQKRGMLTVIR
jgi:gliding motility-associated-like protein